MSEIKSYTEAVSEALEVLDAVRTNQTYREASMGAVRVRKGDLTEAEKAHLDSLAEGVVLEIAAQLRAYNHTPGREEHLGPIHVLAVLQTAMRGWERVLKARGDLG